MAVKFTNNAATTLAAGINNSVTSIAVTDGSVFPTITGSDHFYVTFDDTTNKEIVKVTARSGNTLTVVRGHDNTTARAFSSGDKAELRIVAALLDDVKTDVSSTLTVDTFTGDGSTTAFTLSAAPASEDNLIVFIEGVYQNPGDFTLSGTTLTLDVAPANSRKIIVYHVSHLVSGNNLTHNQFTCNGSTTAFTLSLSPIHENNTQVFLDGVYQQKTDYAVSGTTLTMDTAPANGAILEVMTFTQTEVNTLPASFVSGLTEVTAVGADHFMIFDATDSALKKSLVSDVLESATSISTSADATAITIDSNEKVTFTSDVTTGGHLSVGGSNNELRFYEGSNYVGFEAPALSADKIWVLPAADGSNGQVIKTDGSGNLSFTTIDTSISANSVGITELNVSDGSNGQVLQTNGSGTLSFATVSGTTINNNANNRVITGSGTANTLEGESGLIFDGSNLGVGVASPSHVLSVYKAGDGQTPVRFNTGNNEPLDFYNDSETWKIQSGQGIGFHAKSTGLITFYTTDSETECARWTNNRAFKTKQGTSAYANATSNYNEICSDTGATANLLIRQGSTYYADCINLWYYSGTPNNTQSNFLNAFDSTATRAKIFSNGGFANYQSNDSNLCDEREKKNIVASDSTWNDVKSWNIKTFHYNEDDDNDAKRYGVIAQDIEKTNPDLIVDWEKQQEKEQELWQEGDKPLPEGVKVGDVKEPAKEQIMRKAVKEQQMYIMAIKALQEAMTEIESLKSRIETLEG